MHISFIQALVFLLPALPVGMWIAFSDLKYMRISNRSVILLAVLFVVIAPLVLPFETYLWRLGQMAVLLVAGILLNALRLVGGGDAKYTAAMAGFFSLGDLRLILMIFATMLIAAFLTHRLAKNFAPIRRLTPDWVSWTSGKKFPMGLALSGTLLTYLGLGLAFGL